MRIRILSALAILPLATACTEVTGTPPEEAATEAAAEEAQAPVVVAAATPAPRPPAAGPTPTSERAVPTAPPSVTATVSPPPTPTSERAVPTAPPSVTATVGAPPPPAAEEPDEEPDEEVAEAPAAEPAPTGRLGTTVASLGPPTDPGLWLETALVEAPTSGRIEYNGESVSVQLRPSGGEPGSGSQISVEAMRALGAPLTGLPEVTVFGS